jgi:enediyne biosynthesis protein E4
LTLNTGRFSIVVTHFSDEYAALYRNDGNISFTDVSYKSGIAPSTAPYVGWNDAFLHFENEGWLDLFLVNGHVYPQVDSGEAGPRYREPALLFLNQRDGTTEIVIENLQGGPTILQPQGGPPNHWISLELTGVKSNRLALNARVKATAGSLVQTSEVRSGGSYLSQSDFRIHFGLGSKDRIDKLEILWPSGKTETPTGLAADHLYGVREGEGLVPAKDRRDSTFGKIRKPGPD